MSRIEKKHWKKFVYVPTDKRHVFYEIPSPLCGANSINFANAKRKVTCKTCQRLLGNPLTLGEQK